MGSPMSPAIANIYMNNFAKQCHREFSSETIRSLRHVDDIFVMWPFGMHKLEDLYQRKNNIHRNIKFTEEIEENNTLPFLDVLLKKKNRRVGFHHTTYRNTHLIPPCETSSPPSPMQGSIKDSSTQITSTKEKLSEDEEMTELTQRVQENRFHPEKNTQSNQQRRHDQYASEKTQH